MKTETLFRTKQETEVERRIVFQGLADLITELNEQVSQY